MKGEVVGEVIQILGDTLRIGARAANLQASSPLLGSIPELDSMAVVSVMTALEEHYGFAFDDDEITGEAFATVGTLAALVEAKLAG